MAFILAMNIRGSKTKFGAAVIYIDRTTYCLKNNVEKNLNVSINLNIAFGTKSKQQFST